MAGDGDGVDFVDVLEGVVVEDGALVRFEGLALVTDSAAGRSFLPAFLGIRPGAKVELAGVVLGTRCCGTETQRRDNTKCRYQHNSKANRMETVEKNSNETGSISQLLVEVSNLDGAAQGSWHFCNSLVVCGVASLEDLAKSQEQPQLSSICASDSPNQSVVLQKSIAPTQTNEDEPASKAFIAFSILAGLLLVVILVAAGCAYYWYKFRWKQFAPSESSQQGETELEDIETVKKPVPPIEIQTVDIPTARKKAKFLRGNIDVSGLKLGMPIGKGAFSTVYKAAWGKTTVAVKVIRHDGLVPKGQDLFEAQLGTAVVHPNLVHTYGNQIRRRQDLFTTLSSRPSSLSTVDEAGMNPPSRAGTSESSDVFSDMVDVLKGPDAQDYETWVVMEYCDQGSLLSAIRRGIFFHDAERRYPRIENILLTALDIAKAMAHLHALSTVHGDLKAKNVLLKTKKEDVRGYMCKVGDFGFSRFVIDSHVTTSSYGAVGYMPPELLTEGRLTPAADVYSFGILLWELMSGQAPYRFMHNSDIMVMVTEGKRPEIPAHFPIWYTELVENCWNQVYQLRPSFADIIGRLRGCLDANNTRWQPRRACKPSWTLSDLMAFSFDGPIKRSLPPVNPPPSFRSTHQDVRNGQIKTSAANPSFWKEKVDNQEASQPVADAVRVKVEPLNGFIRAASAPTSTEAFIPNFGRSASVPTSQDVEVGFVQASSTNLMRMKLGGLMQQKDPQAVTAAARIVHKLNPSYDGIPISLDPGILSQSSSGNMVDLSLSGDL